MGTGGSWRDAEQVEKGTSSAKGSARTSRVKGGGVTKVKVKEAFEIHEQSHSEREPKTLREELRAFDSSCEHCYNVVRRESDPAFARAFALREPAVLKGLQVQGAMRRLGRGLGKAAEAAFAEEEKERVA